MFLQIPPSLYYHLNTHRPLLFVEQKHFLTKRLNKHAVNIKQLSLRPCTAFLMLLQKAQRTPSTTPFLLCPN